MLATSRMWPSTRWMPAVWWRQLRAGAPAGERRLGRSMPFQTTFPHRRLHHVYTFSSRPIRRWPCPILSGQAEVVAAVPVVVAEAAAVVRVVAAQAAAAEVAAVVRVVAAQAAVVVVAAEAQAEAAQGVVVKAAPAEVVVPEEAVKAAPPAVAREAAPVVAVTILSLTTATHHTISRGPSCRHSHLRLRPTSRSWLRWRKEREDSRFSTPTISSEGSTASDVNKTSFTSLATCPATPRKGVATR